MSLMRLRLLSLPYPHAEAIPVAKRVWFAQIEELRGWRDDNKGNFYIMMDDDMLDPELGLDDEPEDEELEDVAAEEEEEDETEI